MFRFRSRIRRPVDTRSTSASYAPVSAPPDHTPTWWQEPADPPTSTAEVAGVAPAPAKAHEAEVAEVAPAPAEMPQGASPRRTAADRAALLDRITLDAADQHGLVTGTQFLDAGGSRRLLQSWQETGRLRQVLPGVLLMTGVPVTPHCRILAHCLSAGGVASHRTAARLHTRQDLADLRREVSVPRTRNYRASGVQVHSSRDLHLDTASRRAGIPCTSPARTLLDLGQVLPPDELEEVADDFLRRRLVTWPTVSDCWAVHARRGRPGVAALGGLLRARTGEGDQPDSPPERHMLRILMAAGVLDGVLHYRVYRPDGGFVLETDLAWPEERVVVFYDSFEHHLNRRSFERDPEQRRVAEILGWTILAYTATVLYGRPWVLVDEVLAALGRPALPPAPW